jgi:hypothetical protein
MWIWFAIPLLSTSVAVVLNTFAPASANAVVPGATIVGTVTLTAADGTMWPADGARVVVACAADGTMRTAVTDDHGAFRLPNVPADRCAIEAEVQGFLAQPVTVVTAAQQVVGIDLHLGVVPLRVGVHVGGTTPRAELGVRLRPHRPRGSP